MGDRFYLQQLKRGKRKMAWTDEKKAEVIEAYTTADPTPENSMEIVKDLADEFEESPNGVRMILTKAGVYVKKTPATGGSKASTNGGSSRVSKAAAIESLASAISDAGQDVDQEILDKLTGKAAVYFTGVISAVNS